MRIARFLGVMFGIPLLAAAASAEEVIGVSEVLGPEGPLFVNGNVYYVAWTSSTLSKRDGKTSTASMAAATTASR